MSLYGHKITSKERKTNMKRKPYVAYYRVSTGKQSKDMASQKTAVKKYLQTRWPPEKSFTETESGAKNNRPELEKALAYCKEHKGTLIVAKLDRLSRDLGFIAKLQDDIDFVCCDMPEATRETIGFMAVIARWEREQIAKRTKEALAEKRKEGVPLGAHNPKVRKALERWRAEKKRKKVIKTIVKKVQKKFKEKQRIKAIAIADQKVLPTIRTLRFQGFSYERIALALNESGIPPRVGGQWFKTQVIRVCKRNGLSG